MSNTNTNNQNTNTNNQNTQGGTNMNQNTQIPAGVDPTLAFLAMAMQPKESALDKALAAMITSQTQANNQQPQQPLSPVGQALADVNAFASVVMPTNDELERAADAAEQAARAKYNDAFQVYSATGLAKPQVDAMLAYVGIKEPTSPEITAIREKAKVDYAELKRNNFNTAINGLKAFESTMVIPSTPAPASAPVAAPIPPQQYQRRTFPEMISDVLRANAEAKIAWNKTAYNIK